VKMIAGLSDLLRYTLDRSGAQHVTLDEESNTLRNYLEIQRVRFADRLAFDIDIAYMIAEDLGFRHQEVKFYAIESEDRARLLLLDHL